MAIDRSSKVPTSRRALVSGLTFSILLFSAFVVLQIADSTILQLPAQWLAVAVLPILIGLVYGRHISKFSFAGLELETSPALKPGEYVGPESSFKDADLSAPASRSNWTAQREAEYQRTHRLQLVHTYAPSNLPGLKYDISIYLVRDDPRGAASQTTDFKDVKKAEFFFGPTWKNQIFTIQNHGKEICINTSAWGTFLATCRLTFADGSDSVILHRYIDFEMPGALPVRSQN